MQRLGRLSAVSVNLMQRLADSSCPPQLRMFFLRQLTGVMSRNKDNLIYYRLDGVKQWVERRPDADHDVEMQSILRDATAAREAVNDLGHGVGRAVLAIREEASKARPNQELIRETAAQAVKTREQESRRLVEKLAATRAGIERLQAQLRSE